MISVAHVPARARRDARRRFVVRNRLMRPVRAILDAIARISARDYATPVPQSRLSRRIRHHGSGTRKPARERGDGRAPGPGTRIAAGLAARPFRDRRRSLPQFRRHRAGGDPECRGLDAGARCHRHRRALAGLAIEQPDLRGLLRRRAGHRQSRNHCGCDRRALGFRRRNLRAGAVQRPRSARGGVAGGTDQCDGRDPRPDRRPHQRSREDDPRHRRPDQSARTERHHRGGARGRSRSRLCRGRRRGQEPCGADRDRDRGNLAPGRGDPGRDRARRSPPSARSAVPSAASTRR